MITIDKPQKVTVYLRVTAEFYDPEATPETVRQAVEQTLQDAGFEVEISRMRKPVKVKHEGPVAIVGEVGEDGIDGKLYIDKSKQVMIHPDANPLLNVKIAKPDFRTEPDLRR